MRERLVAELSAADAQRTDLRWHELLDYDYAAYTDGPALPGSVRMERCRACCRARSARGCTACDENGLFTGHL